jgi:hypothetical protein
VSAFATHLNLGLVIATVVAERDRPAGLLDAVKDYA